MRVAPLSKKRESRTGLFSGLVRDEAAIDWNEGLGRFGHNDLKKDDTKEVSRRECIVLQGLNSYRLLGTLMDLSGHGS